MLEVLSSGISVDERLEECESVRAVELHGNITGSGRLGERSGIRDFGRAGDVAMEYRGRSGESRNGRYRVRVRTVGIDGSCGRYDRKRGRLSVDVEIRLYGRGIRPGVEVDSGSCRYLSPELVSFGRFLLSVRSPAVRVNRDVSGVVHRVHVSSCLLVEADCPRVIPVASGFRGREERVQRRRGNLRVIEERRDASVP